MHRLIVTIVTLLVFTATQSLALTQEENIKIKNELTGICTALNKPCTIILSDLPVAQAYTTYKGEIVLTKGLRKILNYEEVRAVGLHEVGHHILEHYKKQDEFIDKQWDFRVDTLKQFRYQNEVQADIFATSYFIYINQKNCLPDALLRLTDPKKININTSTHPSTQKRLQYIEEFSKYGRTKFNL